MERCNSFSQELSQAVVEAVGSVYAAPQAADDDPALYGVDGVYSAIYFKGDLIGKIAYFMRGADAARIVAAMLGAEELSEDAADVLDGIGEILNITAGCFKKRLDTRQRRLEISVPSTRRTSVLPPDRWEQNTSLFFLAGDARFRVMLSFREVPKEEKPAAAPAPQAKLKMSAAELLKQVLAKKKAP